MITLDKLELAKSLTSFEKRPPLLLGRRSECELLEEVVAATLAGRGRSLVICGEAGSGKSALLGYVAEQATGCRVLRAAGAESEHDLPFAGLQRLCAPLLDRLEALPMPQRSALATAFGLERGEEPDRFVLAVGVQSLLTLVAGERPLLCVVDDAHWLDPVSAETLAFVARRASAGSLGLVATIETGRDSHVLDGLPELVLAGLADEHARALLDTVVAGPLDERVRDRMVAETHGNPQALLEALRGVRPDELAGGFGVPVPARQAERGDELMRLQLESLPRETQQLVLLAAAEPSGSATIVWRAAAELGIGPEAAGPAVEAGMVSFGAQILFRDPLTRASAYRAASGEPRREAHRALAEATDSPPDADWRAWHRAQATVAPDEEVAVDLDVKAEQARARGGIAAAAAFLERSAELTPSPSLRARRALAAARGKALAGAPEAARRLLALAEAGHPAMPEEARLQLVRAELELVVNGEGDEAIGLLLQAAARLETADPAEARESYLAAFAAALATGRANDVARAVAASALGEPPVAPRAGDLLLAGLTSLCLDGYPVAGPSLASALRAVRGELAAGDQLPRWLPLAARVARALGDDETWDELTAHVLKAARSEGRLGCLPAALNERMAVEHLAGNLDVVQELAAELDATIERTGVHACSHARPLLAARRGNALELSSLIEARAGDPAWLAVAESARAELLNSIGGWSESLSSTEWVTAQPAELWSSPWVVLELVEAAVRVGEPDRTAAAVTRLGELAAAGQSDWARGTELLCRALLARDEAAEPLYREAIDRLARTRARVVLARAELLYGEWLRRRGRRVDARVHLRVANELFGASGADGFVERARRELHATGETARKRVDETRADLTPQEAEIAGLAAAGNTNTEIGARLFLSPRTVEWHLRKIYPKLGVASRRELRNALPTARLTAVAA